MNEQENLIQAINALEAQRTTLGDAVVDSALVPLQEKLLLLQARSPSSAKQRKQVTVLFADVSGFTALSETLDPEEVTDIINHLWSQLDASIVGQGGMIDKHIGDAVMALFGAPIAHEDDPERAIQAGLAMQKTLRSFATTIEPGTDQPDKMPELRMRIGINTGLVMLGLVGSTTEYTAMGDAVNVASRLEQACPIGGLLISHDTYRHVRGVFDVHQLEPIKVKGKTEPIQTYLVDGTRPRAFRVTTRGVVGIETRTIGRDRELRQLQAVVTQMRRRKHDCARIVTVVGEAGVGKSRLLYEFLNWLDVRQDRYKLFRGRATENMVSVPYSLIRNVIASYFDIPDGVGAAESRSKLEEGIVSILGEKGHEYAPFIGHVLGYDFSSSPYLAGILTDVRQIHDRAYYYVVQLFKSFMASGAVGIMLEDIHWADQGSLELVDFLARNCADLPLLIVCAARASLYERYPTWGQASYDLRIDLQLLSAEFSQQLVKEILQKTREIPPDLRDLVVTMAEGNPFYLEEIIKMLIEDHVILVSDEEWTIDQVKIRTLKVPPTLTGILQVRLDGLPEVERKTLQRASVVGRVFWDDALSYLGDSPETDSRIQVVDDDLSQLQNRELVFVHEPSAFVEAHEYIFKHAILLEVTYETVLKQSRRRYHEQVANWLIERSGERAAAFASAIAEHFRRAEAHDRAATWFARAGQQARQAYLPEVAVSSYRNALEQWDQSRTQSDTLTTEMLEAYAGLGDVLDWQGQFVEGEGIFETMLELAEKRGDKAAQAQAWHGIATTQLHRGEPRAALESASRSEQLAQEAGSGRHLASAYYVKGWAMLRMGEMEQALQQTEQALEVSTHIGNRSQEAIDLNLLGAINSMMGRADQALRKLEEALRVFRELDDRRWISNLLNNLGVIAEGEGDYRKCFDLYQEALTIARGIGYSDGEMTYLSNLGGARVRLGDHAAAKDELQRVIEMSNAANLNVLPETYRYLAEAHLGQGDDRQAFEAARRSLEMAWRDEAQDYVAASWRTLGRIAANTGRPVTLHGENDKKVRRYGAQQCFEESARICNKVGLDGELARTMRAWAKYEIELGDLERGQAMWQEAREMFRKLDAHHHVADMEHIPARVAAARDTT